MLDRPESNIARIESQSEVEPRKKFIDQLKSRDDSALIFLKGGQWGGLNSELKGEILSRLSKWFDVTEGEENELSLEEIFSRWGGGYLKYPTLEVMKKNPKFDLDFLKKGEKLLGEGEKDGFQDWLKEAEENAGGDTGLLRLEMLLAYYASGGQNILMKLKPGVDRKKIMEDLNVGTTEGSPDYSSLPFQEFVKKVIVGETTALNSPPGTLRSLVADKMKSGEMLPCADLWEHSEDEWTLKNKLSDSKLMASNLLNAIHAPGPLAELEIELQLMSDNDAKKFLGALEAQSSIPEYDLAVGVQKVADNIREKIKEAGTSLVVEVAGGSASGKTSAVAEKLRESFGDEAMILSMDDYYKGKAFMDAEKEKGNILNWDQPEALDMELFREHLRQLRNGQPINKPIYDIKTGERSGTELIDPKRIIIAEGLFALNDALKSEGDMKVFVDIGTHGQILRRVLRDIERTRQKPADIIKYFSDVVQPMHEEHISGTKKNADVIIRNEYQAKVEAKKSGLHEMQIKFKAEDLDEEKLRRLGAERLGFTSQVDNYYNPHDRNLAATDEMLRIRRESGHRILTYKGPRIDSQFRTRPKFEFEIDEETENKFLSFYGDMIKTIKKERELYQLEGTIFSIDSVTKIENGRITELGMFLEIRSAGKSLDQKKLEQIITGLGLRLEDGIKDPYLEM
jgi:uridine kinase